MDPINDYKLIKKHYGEKMAQFCCHQGHFSSILETPGLLFELISSRFAYSKIIYEDIEKYDVGYLFVNEIISIYNARKKENQEDEFIDRRTPEELLEEAGYTLYECKTEEDIQSFRHYYYRGKDAEPLKEYVPGTRPQGYEGEELCTFSGDRLDRCYVFFAVKNNADELKREDFLAPEREDEYGTSVISIQFSRGGSNTLSIKNRYNHTIRDKNPDATFGNNLDNIIPGLKAAFEREYDLTINSANEEDAWNNMQGYVLAEDGKYYKYNYEAGNIYYCPDNIVIDHFKIKQYDKSRYLILDNYIVDKHNKTIKRYDGGYVLLGGDELVEEKDSFIESLGEIKAIEDGPNKTLIINKEIIIGYDNNNRIISYTNKNVTKIGGLFLENNSAIEEINLPNVREIGGSFLIAAKNVNNLYFPELTKVGSYFMYCNEMRRAGIVNMPKLETVGNSFLTHANIEMIHLPELKSAGSTFLGDCSNLIKVSLPKLESINDFSLSNARNIKRLELPNVTSIGNYFLRQNTELEELILPNVEDIGDSFLANDRKLTKLELPNLVIAGDYFFPKNPVITSICLPKLRIVGSCFMGKCKNLKEIDLPSLETADRDFCMECSEIQKANLPNIDIYSYYNLPDEIKELIEEPKVK